MIISRIIKSVFLHRSKGSLLPVTVRNFSGDEITRTNKAEPRMSINVFRQKMLYKATVQNIFDASPSIKVVRLSVANSDFSFKAGQWVDFYIPGIEDVTGYSMTSGPHLAEEKRVFDLAVKYGKFAPTHWIHNECTVGSQVEIQVGGDFYYDPQPGSVEEIADLLLIGGGVGVNPLVSIVSQYCHMKKNTSTPVVLGKAHLLYSSKTKEELIFMDYFTKMENSLESLSCQYFVTAKSLTEDNQKIKNHRIREENLRDCLKDLQMNHTLCYICGPSNMTDNLEKMLLRLGVKQNYIRYEKWW